MGVVASVQTLTGLPAEVVDSARLVASELATNALGHSRSALPGGKYVGRVEIGPVDVLIEVIDQGSDNEVPEVVDVADGVHGRGLLICCKVGHLDTYTTPDGGRRVAVWLPVHGQERTP
jgi:anti-sigma regulatory factor (Ser/Thr protein kinase)